MARTGGSIRDVARVTGLSTATISRVMNGGANVSQVTRDKVLAAAHKLDYLPNPAARALSTARSKTIAAIIPTIEHSVYAKFIAAIERALAARGYTLVLSLATTPAEEQVSARKLLGMGAEAFILSGAAHDPDTLDLLRRRNIPFVFSSVWDGDSTHPTIGYDNEGLAFEAVTYLRGLGHNDIGVIHGPLQESDRITLRLNGAKRAAQADVRLTSREVSVSVAGGKAAAQQLLQMAPRCSAILCLSDVQALGVYFAAVDAGLRIPEDISVMGFDNLDWSGDIVPPLTTFDLPAMAMGTNVADQLADHLERKAELGHHLLSCALIERSSVARRGA